MDEQFKPIEDMNNYQEEQFKPIQEEKKIEVTNNFSNTNDVIQTLPEWNLEPPIEINRCSS